MKTLNIIVMVLILVGLISSALAQNTGKIVGQVTDAKTGEALPGCNIFIEDLSLGASSDQDGYYVILNVPPGVYDVHATMIGYTEQVQQGVRVVSNLTTQLSFKLKQQILQGEKITVVAYKTPPVQKDLTYKIQAVSAEEISQIPLSTMKDLLVQQAGVVPQLRTMPVSSMPMFGQFATVPSDGLHFRGGRENETLYLLDGINVTDGLWGGFSIDQLGELMISSLETYSGTFDPRYGEAMSGVVNITSHDRIDPHPKVAFKAFSDKHGIESQSHNTYSWEVMFNSALPFLKNVGVTFANRIYSTDGYIYGYIYPEYVNSEGRDKSGTPKKVPMQYLDTQFSFGKLIWKPVASVKFSIGGYYAKNQKGVYNHYFKYNPYGTPRVWLDDDLLYTKLDYTINPKSFVKLYAAHYERTFKSYVWDDPAKYEVLPQTGTAEFSITGEDWVYFNTYFKRQQLGIDYVNQLTRIHNIALGFNAEKMETQLTRRNPDGFAILEGYKYRPLHIGGYLNEKMEFTDMGLIVNLGLRFDYHKTTRKILEDLAKLWDLEAPVKEEKPVFYVTPRLGISFPIAEKAAVRFGYGHYYQFPTYFKIFEGNFLDPITGEYRPNPELAEQQTGIAGMDIKPEKTVNYEVGIQNKISDVMALDITGFYRKTSNLIGTMISQTPEGKRFQLLQNMDYATVKGIEVSFKKYFSDHFSTTINYTYSRTFVSTSVLFTVPIDEARTFPANWDQPHVLSGNVYFEADNGFGFSLYGSASSGLPYTRSQFDPNGERAPWIHALDLNIFKNFKFMGMKEQFFIQILNVPNRKNVWWVYPDSGIPGDDANPATSHDYTNNPSMYGPGRVIQFGFKIWN